MTTFLHKGIEISVNTYGHFAATVDGIEFQKPTLIELQGVLDREVKAKSTKVSISLPITGAARKGGSYNPQYTALHGTITGINRTTGNLLIDSVAPKDTVWDYVLVDTPENRQLASDFAEASNRASGLRQQIEALNVRIAAVSQISHELYPTKIAQLQQLYDSRKRQAEDTATKALH